MTSDCLPHQVCREISITDAMDTRNAKSHALKAISILKGLEQARFDQIVDAFVEMHFEAGQKVISHGEIGSALNNTLHASAHHGALPHRWSRTARSDLPSTLSSRAPSIRYADETICLLPY